MKKLIVVVCALCLLLGCAAHAEALLGRAVPDFTAPTTDGGSVTLSELLAQKRLVVLNLFASWCPPCAREFPEMEAVYERLSDRMEVVALSAYEGDTLETIADYKASFGLTFPMGVTDGGLDFVQLYAYPTTLFIDRAGNAGYVQVGAFANASSFEAVANAFLADDYTSGTVAMYGVYAVDQDDMLVPGVTVRLTPGGDSPSLTTGDDGTATLVTEAIGEHRVEILEVPEGYSFDPGIEVVAGPQSGWTEVRVNRE